MNDLSPTIKPVFLLSAFLNLIILNDMIFNKVKHDFGVFGDFGSVFSV
jgi:hypothetical protein